jgi:hypothetical protein
MLYDANEKGGAMRFSTSQVLHKRSLRTSIIVPLTAALVLVWISTANSSTPVTAGYSDFSYGTSVSAPTGQKPQSKLWFNDGSWWGVLWNRSTAKYQIHKFDVPSQSWTSTSTIVDPRRTSQADVLWDGSKLYVASAQTVGTTSTDLRLLLYRFSYSASSKAYSLDPGFPVSPASVAPEAAVLDKDSTGQLWLTYTDNNGAGGRSVLVTHSTSSDASWVAPYVLPVSNATNLDADDISTLVSYGNNSGRYIGVLYSNQTDETLNFASHPDGAADTVWTRTVVNGGPKVPDDHLNIKSLMSDDSGRVFAIVKTSLNDKSPSVPSDPLIVLWVLSNGTWSSTTVWTVAENATRAIVLLDSQHRRVYAFMAAPCCSGGTVYMKQSSYDSLGFPSGLGTPFIQSSTDPKINNPTSTKQELNASTGLLVEAGDDSTRYYLHGYLSLDDTPTTTSTTTTTTTTPTTTTSTTTTSTTTTTTTTPTTVTVAPSADSYVDSVTPDTNYGSALSLRVDASPVQSTYLRFDLSPYSGRTLISATLRVTTTTATASGSPGPEVVKSVADTSWEEGSLTYSNRPPVGTSLGSLNNPTASNTTYEIPLNAGQIQPGGPLSLAMDSTNSDAFYVNSKEATTNRPQLVLTFA